MDGLARIVLRAAGDRSCAVTSDAVTSDALTVTPLPFAPRDEVETGAYVRVAAAGWRDARRLGTADVTCTATDGSHLLFGALEPACR